MFWKVGGLGASLSPEPPPPLNSEQGNLNDSSDQQTFYRIVDWEEFYERSQSRKLPILYWVPMTNRMGEDGYMELMNHQNGTAYFGVWTALVFLASACKPRGDLLRSNRMPHTLETIHGLSRIPIDMLREAIPKLLDIGWIVSVPMKQQQRTSATPEAKQTNGKIVEPPPLDDPWRLWWKEWVRATIHSANEPEAEAAWKRWVKSADLVAVLACSQSYFSSDKVARGIVMHPDNWIARQAANGWKSRWAPAKAKLDKSFAASVGDVMSERVKRGENPI